MGKNLQQDILDQKLIEVYKTYGLQYFMDVCSELLVVHDPNNWEKKKLSNGEVCEVVLRVLTVHYLRTRRHEGKVFHSCILEDADNSKSDFCTELDFVLLTPSFCVTGECKSFAGDIIATDECQLTRSDGSITANVSKQTRLHAACLKKELQQYVRPGLGLRVPPYGAFCFLYSNGTLEDRRDKEAKGFMPIVTAATLFDYYDRLFARFNGEVYLYDRIATVFQHRSTSEVLRAKHRAYLHY